MPWKDSPASSDPNIIRNNVTWSVTRAGGGVVNENFIMDLNRSTGAYIVYRRNPLTQAEIPVIRSDQIDGRFRINLQQGSFNSPIGIEQTQYQRLTQTKLAEIADNQRRDYYQKTDPSGAAALGIPGFRNTANGNPVTPVIPLGSNGDGGQGQTPPGGSPTNPQADGNFNQSLSNDISEIGGDQNSRSRYENLYYPIDIRNTTQDYIIFTQKMYGTKPLQSLAQAGGNFSTNQRNFGPSMGSVVLPIQPTISDSNSVSWGDDRLNAIKSAAAGASYNAMVSAKGFTASLFDDAAAAASLFKDSGSVQNAIRTYFAGQAVGAENLLSRTSGAVLNPNLELLFGGPTLRPFTFTFQLSPRDQPEAMMVKKIIRYFKQGMAVKRGEKNLFLKAPNVFDIKYKFKGSEEHKALNRIKTCALQTCSVDYTPNGTYMTFDDGTMVSYSITLQFTELEPVYSDDYNNLDGSTLDSAGIGY